MTLTLQKAATPPQASRASQLRIYTASNPAAGSEWTESVPAGETWQLLAVKYSFVASAAVATRAPNLHPAIGGVGFAVVPVPLTVTASQTVNYLFTLGVNAATSTGVALAPLWTFLLPPASTVGSQTANLQAGDQIVNIAIYALAYA